MLQVWMDGSRSQTGKSELGLAGYAFWKRDLSLYFFRQLGEAILAKLIRSSTTSRDPYKNTTLQHHRMVHEYSSVQRLDDTSRSSHGLHCH